MARIKFLGAEGLPLGVAAGGSASGVPKLTGVESRRNKGRPSGRRSGNSRNKPASKACKPNDVKVVQPRRERPVHEESSVSANMVSS
jgi:hypothetical protein